MVCFILKFARHRRGTMGTKHHTLWQILREGAIRLSEEDALLAPYFHEFILKHASLEEALSAILADKLASTPLTALSLQREIERVFETSAEIRAAVRKDLHAIEERDPAAGGVVEPFLHYKGFHSLEAYRVSHSLWNERRFALAYYIHNRVTEIFAVDIHPAAKIGKGIFIDHATGVVIGETAHIGDDVSLLHGVTLGGTGKEHGDRHPKVGNGVLIGAGTKILGNVRIGDGSKIGAGSVVLDHVPPHSTVVGVPGRVVGHPKTGRPSLLMDQSIDIEEQVFSSYTASML
jgi:serine O-acetyltransferase